MYSTYGTAVQKDWTLLTGMNPLESMCTPLCFRNAVAGLEPKHTHTYDQDPEQMCILYWGMLSHVL